ncbi:MAG: hypothetical protein QXR57_06210 [Metallosphaera sp.]|uniref:Uncharacterized protein n=1 Tax=Metallosphaera cuprina (strain Ar-4) TaxID=1006006 RepID=F4G1F0_METCR|nr:hypothetical protein [Metallosphaera cuprina]AEB94763.1 conserved hypothetical protein [Metallosphaera cuprina Ar-4]
MEFLDKKHRTVLMAIAKEGFQGVEMERLIASLSPILTKDAIIKVIEDLYFSQYVLLLRDSNEIRYIASKAVRNAMISFEFQRYKLTKFLETLKSMGNSQVNQESKQKAEEVIKVIKEGLVIISKGYLQLLSEVPELTVPEYSELLELLTKELFGKLIQLIDNETSKEDLDKLMELIAKYRGEKDAETMRNLMALSSRQSTAHPSQVKP